MVSTKCTELYQIKTKQYSILGIPILWVYTSPRHALTPGAMPAECWAFQGFPGYLGKLFCLISTIQGQKLPSVKRPKSNRLLPAFNDYLFLLIGPYVLFIIDVCVVCVYTIVLDCKQSITEICFKDLLGHFQLNCDYTIRFFVTIIVFK